jgi:nicotinamide-nucleotide amidase
MSYTIEEAQAALGNLGDPSLKPSEYEFARAAILVASVARTTIGCAESVTGGLVSQLLTSVPGASEVFRGGVVAYSTDIKSGVLNVSSALLAKGGAIQADVALEMATGVAALLGSDIGMGITGVAGPSNQDGAPVGTVHVAVVDRTTNASRVHSLRLEGTRDEIRVQAATALIGMLLDVLVPKTDLVRS